MLPLWAIRDDEIAPSFGVGPMPATGGCGLFGSGAAAEEEDTASSAPAEEESAVEVLVCEGAQESARPQGV